MEKIDKLAHLLQSHAWRDKILRTLTFACHLVAAKLSGTKLATRLALFGAAIGRVRAFNRFLDDIPMLQATIGYGLGTQRDPLVHRALQVLGNISSQLFFPAEHIALFCQLNVLPEEKATLWAGRSTMLWALSLFAALVRNLMSYFALHKAKARLLKTQPSSDNRDVKAIDGRIRLLTLNLSKDICDFANAINWCPLPIFWSGKLTSTQSASFGVVASLLGIVLLHQG